MKISAKRAEYVALLSLILSVIFFIIALLVGLWSGFFAVFAVSWFILLSALISLVLVIQFHQRALAEQEKLDMSQLGVDERSSTIFQAKDEQAALFAVAQRRLGLLEKWFLPIFSTLIAVYQTGIGLYLFKVYSATAEVEAKQPLICAVCMTAIAFVSFLISRYATGMSVQLVWKPLRACGSSLLGVAVLCFVLAGCLAWAQFQTFVPVNVIGWVICVLFVLLGVETALNVVLDIYRPRLKDQYGRTAFDSRLLGIINEPGGLFRTAAGAIDYQFGFEVSQTWFYKLLEKAIVPLILFAAVTLYSLSCIVVVAPNEEAIIEHFGNPLTKAGQVRKALPGLTFKLPWPIDVAYKYPTKKIMEIYIGYAPKVDPKTKEVKHEPFLLWGKTHYEYEEELLVASEQSGVSSEAGGVPVSLVIAAVPVQYRIKDLYSFIYNHKDSEKTLECICYRELTRFAASATIEVDDEQQDSDNSNHSLLGAGRAEAKKILTERIQSAADKEGLGVEIVFLGLQGIHPPVDVAADYQRVVGAVQIKQASILNAYAEKNRTLSTLAGSIEDANELYNLAGLYQLAKEQNKPKEIEKLANDLDIAFAHARGEIFMTLREAKSGAFEKATLARAAGERFADQLKAYRAAKDFYKRQLRLSVLENVLDDTRKFVVVAGANDMQVFIVDFEEKLTPDLYDITGLEELSTK